MCILGQVLSAVNYLHTMVHRIIHRDIKSANILLDGSLNARLGDFGLARLCPELTAASATGAGATTRIFGTPGYLDPHYAQTGKVTAASDIFSMGVVALELVSSLKVNDAAHDPPILLHRFEEAREDGRLREQFIDTTVAAWPADRGVELLGVTESWLHSRAQRRPTATEAGVAVEELSVRWKCTPIDLACVPRNA